MKKRLWLLIGIVLLMGCSRAKAVDEPTKLYILAAASLTESMEELKTTFESTHDDVDVILTFASSGSLQNQIEQGAPADVFISASLGKMQTLQEESLLYEDTYVELLKNDIVLVVPKDRDIDVTFESLTDDGVTRIAMGEPESVPAGKYAKEVLDYIGITEALSSKTVFAKDVKEVLTWVELGEVDAGMVYSTDAYVSEKVDIADNAPVESHAPIIYPAAVVVESEHVDMATVFLEFLQEEESMDIFTHYGFKQP